MGTDCSESPTGKPATAPVKLWTRDFNASAKIYKQIFKKIEMGVLLTVSSLLSAYQCFHDLRIGQR